MGIKLFRNTHKIGNSRYLTLPVHWVNFWGGGVDKVLIVGDQFLVIFPEPIAGEATKVVDLIEQKMTDERS